MKPCRISIINSTIAEVDEVLGSCVMQSIQFWPGGFDGEVTLTQEEPLGFQNQPSLARGLRFGLFEAA